MNRMEYSKVSELYAIKNRISKDAELRIGLIDAEISKLNNEKALIELDFIDQAKRIEDEIVQYLRFHPPII